MRFEMEGQKCNRNSFTAGRTAWIVLAALLLVATGCGSTQDPDRLPVFPATGKISFKGAVPDGAVRRAALENEGESTKRTGSDPHRTSEAGRHF